VTMETTEAPKNGSNGKSPVTDEERRANNWPAIETVAKQLRVPFSRVQEYVREGYLTVVKVRGRARFNPEEVDKMVEVLGEIPSEDEAEDRRASRAGMPAEAVRATAELVRQVSAQVKEVHELCMQLHKLNMESWEKAAGAQDKAFTRVLDRCSKYETVIDQYLDAREEQFSNQVLRDMAVRTNEATLSRRQEMWSTTKDQLVKLLEIVGQRVGVDLDPKTLKKLKLAGSLLQSMPRVQLDVLLESDFIDDKQKAILRELLRELDESEAQAQKAKADAAQAQTAEAPKADAAPPPPAEPAQSASEPTQESESSHA